MYVYIYVCLFTWLVVVRYTNTCLDSDGTRLITQKQESPLCVWDGVFTQTILKILTLVVTVVG